MGAVCEDYSASGDAWNYLNHDHARNPAIAGRGWMCNISIVRARRDISRMPSSNTNWTGIMKLNPLRRDIADLRRVIVDYLGT
jgi:hypothetical protein